MGKGLSSSIIVVAVIILASIVFYYSNFLSATENVPSEAFEQNIWNQRIENALEPTECPPVSSPKYGSLYYKGPLIDSHYHIPHLPDYPPWDTGDGEDNSRPLLGKNVKISDIVCTLEQENTTKAFAFFPVYKESFPSAYLEVAYKTMQNYPDRFVPFIMPPDNDNSLDGSPTVDAGTLQEMLEVYPDLFKGYGEIGLYSRLGGASELPPDSPKLLEIYPVVREHKLVVYFHLGEGQKDSYERILDANPDINFIFHGDQLIPYIEGRQNLKNIGDILGRHSNVYYTVDELYGDVWMLRPDVTKEEFLVYLDNYEELLQKDLDTWKELIERHPDQFMWGTDRSDQVVWSHDPEVGKALSNYGRAFTARLDPDVQQKFAYRNAERLLEQ